MRLGIPIFTFFMLISSYIYSGESNTVQNDGKLLDIYFQLAPNSQGLLEGQCFLDMNWWRYMKSGLGYASQNSVVVTNSGNSNYTLSSSSQVYTLDVISTRPYLIQDVLKSLFNFSSAPDFVDLDAGVKLVMSSVQESQYGYINQT
jgi:hypothetical protein